MSAVNWMETGESHSSDMTSQFSAPTPKLYLASNEVRTSLIKCNATFHKASNNQITGWLHTMYSSSAFIRKVPLLTLRRDLDEQDWMENKKQT